MDVKPSDTASHRLASYQTPSWMLSTLSAWFPLGKFLSLMWGSTKVCRDFFVCFAHPLTLLSQWPHCLCLCRWTMETSVVMTTFFTYVSLIHGNVCSSGHIVYVCVADPWKLVVVATLFIFVSLIHGKFCCNGHILCLCRWSMETSVVVATFSSSVNELHHVL
jgi:hypothetical protein